MGELHADSTPTVLAMTAIQPKQAWHFKANLQIMLIPEDVVNVSRSQLSLFLSLDQLRRPHAGTTGKNRIAGV
jgi:hypothetical protein